MPPITECHQPIGQVWTFRELGLQMGFDQYARDPFCTKVADEFTGGTIHSLIWFNCNAEQSIRRTLWLERVGR